MKRDFVKSGNERILRNTARGAVYVEIAVVLPIALLMLGGFVNFGLLFNNSVTFQDAARATGRFLSREITIAEPPESVTAKATAFATQVLANSGISGGFTVSVVGCKDTAVTVQGSDLAQAKVVISSAQETSSFLSRLTTGGRGESTFVVMNCVTAGKSAAQCIGDSADCNS